MNIHGFGSAAVHVQADPVFSNLDLSPRLPQLLQHRIHQMRPGIPNKNLATGEGRRHQVGPGFNTIGQHLVTRTRKALDPLDSDEIGTGPPDSGTHAVEAAGQVHHLGFPRGVFDQGLPVGQGCRHHQVFRPGHRYHIQHQPGGLQAF